MKKTRITAAILLALVLLLVTGCGSTQNLKVFDWLLSEPSFGEANQKIGDYVDSDVKVAGSGAGRTWYTVSADYRLSVCGVKGKILAQSVGLGKKLYDDTKPSLWIWSPDDYEVFEKGEKAWKKSVIQYFTKKYGAYHQETMNAWNTYVWTDKETGHRVYLVNPESVEVLLCVDYD